MDGNPRPSARPADNCTTAKPMTMEEYDGPATNPTVGKAANATIGAHWSTAGSSDLVTYLNGEAGGIPS